MKIGEAQLAHGLFLAPMAGATDRAFRRACRQNGSEFTVSEMVSAKALCYEQKSPKFASRSKSAPLACVLREEYPMAVQLFGHEPELMAEAARMIEACDYLGCKSEMPPVAIDINMGCPVNKVVANGEGSALMKEPALAAEIVRAMSRAVKLPITVKIRAGWDKSSVNAVEMAKRLEDAGAKMICVHGRTREQMYAPSADWGIIGAVKDAVSIPVVGNGDIFSAADALRMMRETNCDGVMIARGAQGNPWIFQEIRCAMEGQDFVPPTIHERFTVALEHASELVRLHGERVGIPESRKHMAWYLHGVRGAASARFRVMQAESIDDLRAIFDELERLSEQENG